jgi:DNA-binding transcriptional regulator YhcF (GntR family)
MSFTPISNELLDMDMSDGAFRLYCLIQSYCFGDKKECYPSQRVLANRLRKSVRTVQRYITELIELGLITVKRRGSTSNLYQVLKKAIQGSAEAASKTVNKIKQKCEGKKKNSKSSFNNFQQRSYDMNKLENLLLNRDNNISYADCLNHR